MKTGFASSFADPADVAAFKKCKAQGKSDQECLKAGDNGLGCYGDSMINDLVPYVAVPPDDMIERWSSVLAAKHKPVNVTIDGKTHTCLVGDRMPWRKNIKNGAVIDLAPGAQKLFKLKAPFMIKASWDWA